MHCKSVLPVIALFGATPLFAQGDEVPIGPAPGWAVESELLSAPDDIGGLLFVRRQDTIVHLHEDGQSTFSSQHFRILHPQALQMGNIAISWNPASGQPVVHRLQIHRDGETIDVLEESEFEVLRREDQLEQAMLDGQLTAVLRVSDLRVGDEIDFAFTLPSHDPTLGQLSSGVLLLPDSPPAGRIRFGLSWTDGQAPRLRLPEEFESNAHRRPEGLDVLFDNAPIRNAPKDAPPRYAWHRVAQYTDFDDWQGVSQRFATLFDEASALQENSPLRSEAQRIATQNSDPHSRMQAALELVQRQVRYVYIGLHGGNYTPADADTTWQRRYGDCKGKTAMLLALLSELGIEARAVLVSNNGVDDGLDERLPSPDLFDHVLVQAQLDGETWWLDGTFPDVIEARTRPFLPYRWVLPLSNSGSDLEQVSYAPPPLPLDMGIHEIDARAGFDQPARTVSTTVKRGIDGLAEYMTFSALTDAQLEAAFASNLIGGPHWDSIEDVSYRYDRKTQASILTIAGTGPVDWDDYSGGRYSLSLPGGGFSPPERRQRAADQDQNAPYYSAPGYSCYATTVRLPQDTKLQNWGFNSVFDTMIYGKTYYRMMERRDDHTIRMVRGSRLERAEISPATAAKDNERLERFDNSKANIGYDPKDTKTPWGRLRPVPAVYEFDWTSENAPCLPPDLMGGDGS